MNCEQANKIDIVGFLSSQGKSPEKPSGNGLLYCSPLRNEKTASFKVDPVKNVWFDFGTGTGGQLVDLVCQMYGVSISGALLILSGASIPAQSFSFQKQNEISSSIEIKHVQKLQNRALIQYLEGRGIPFRIASGYTKEAYYNIINSDTSEIRKYFAVAFENDKSGYELRNKIWKGGTSPKTITTIPGNPEKINVFEGFMDFLSALVHYQQPEPKNTTIVLNSLSHLRHLYNILPNYSQINLFLDNDLAGQKAVNEIQSRFSVAINQAIKIYPNHKDFNEFLNSGK